MVTEPLSKTMRDYLNGVTGGGSWYGLYIKAVALFHELESGLNRNENMT